MHHYAHLFCVLPLAALLQAQLLRRDASCNLASRLIPIRAVLQRNVHVFAALPRQLFILSCSALSMPPPATRSQGSEEPRCTRRKPLRDGSVRADDGWCRCLPQCPVQRPVSRQAAGAPGPLAGDRRSARSVVGALILSLVELDRSEAVLASQQSPSPQGPLTCAAAIAACPQSFATPST